MLRRGHPEYCDADESDTLFNRLWGPYPVGCDDGNEAVRGNLGGVVACDFDRQSVDFFGATDEDLRRVLRRAVYDDESSIDCD